MTAAAREWIGLMLAMTSGCSAAAAPGSRTEAARAAGWSQVGRRRAVMEKPLLERNEMLYCIIQRGSQGFGECLAPPVGPALLDAAEPVMLLPCRAADTFPHEIGTRPWRESGGQALENAEG